MNPFYPEGFKPEDYEIVELKRSNKHGYDG